MSTRTISMPKNAPVVRALLTLLAVGLGGFALAMGVLASQASQLTCAPADGCVHLENYPLGVTLRTVVPPIARVGVREKPGRRGTSLDLTLFHEDGTTTEYPGVGTNGDRAAEVAESLSAYLASPSGERTFELRSGSVPFGAALFLFGLLVMFMAPSVHGRVTLRLDDEHIEARVGRWPLPTRATVVPRADVLGVHTVARVVGGREVHALALHVRGGPDVDLGTTFGALPPALERAAALDAELAL